MDSFFVKAYDRCNIGGTDEEKLWLSFFSNYVTKYVLKENSYQSCTDLSLSILECISSVITKHIKDADDADGADDDDQQATPRWTRYHVMSLESLAKKNEICAGQLDGDILKDTHSVTDLGHNTLMPTVPSFLIGYVKCCPSSLETIPACGTIFLEDNSAYLPIEISNADINWLNQLVILPSWTFIPVPAGSCKYGPANSSCHSLPSSGYIEVSSRCAPVYKTHADNLVSTPVSLSVFDYQEHKRSNKKAQLNIHGKVTAISPVHSMVKSNPFFLMQLTCSDSLISTSIVVQGSQFMHWVKFLHLEKEYIVTNICETTMNKGTKNERKILACNKSSHFLEYRPGNNRTAQRKRKLAEEDVWSHAANTSTKRFKTSDNKHVPTDNTSDQENSASRLTKTRQPLTLSYKGVITKSYPGLEIGTYELDDKVRLYTVHQPCPHYGRGLRVGAEIALYNVHLVKKAKDVLGLCCCTLSSIRITRFSPFASEWKPSVFTASPLVLHGQILSLPDYVDLTQCCGKLIKMFSSLFRRSSLIGYLSSQQQARGPNKESVIAKLLNPAKASSSFHNKPRNIYDEFFNHPHTCSPTRPESVHLEAIYTIMEVRDMVMEKTKNNPWQTGASDAGNGTKEWLYQIIPCKDLCTEAVVMGCLKASRNTGYLKLYDQTSSIPILIIKQDSNSDLTAEYNSVLDARDCIVKLKRFTAVVEQFRNSAFDSLASSRKTRLYFQARIADLEVIVTKESSLMVDSKLIKEKPDLRRYCAVDDTRKASSDSNGKQSKETESCLRNGNENPMEISEQKNCEIQEKSNQKNLMSTTFNGNEPMKDRSLTSRDSSTTWEIPPKVFTCKVLFLVRHRENLLLKKKPWVFYACAVDIKVLAISSREGVEQLDHEQGLSMNKASSLNDLSEFTVTIKSVALRLQQQNVIWHPFLCDGCFYILEERSSRKESSLITKATNNTSKALLDVTSSMDIKQVYLPRDTGQEELQGRRDVVIAMKEARKRFMCDVDEKMRGIEDILTSNKGELSEHKTKPREEGIEQVNVKGRVIIRELRLSDSSGQLLRGNNVLVPRFGPIQNSAVQQMELGFGYLGNKNMFLRLQDLESPNTLDVYVDLSRAPYIDGILPGAIISCRRFLCKLSRGGNMYCSFDSCSSITIDESATEYFAPSAQRASRNIPRACSSESSVKHPQMSNVPHRLLIDFIKCESSGSRIHTISQVRCRVTAVQKVSMRWQCSRCGHVIVKEECSQGCTTTEGFKFSAEARCLVEDGTAEATLYLAEDTVPFLLRLSHDGLSRLKSHALNVGELLYQRYSYGNKSKGDTSNLLSRQADGNRVLADHCCSSGVKRGINIYCKHTRSLKNKPDMGQTGKGYDTRSININHTEYSTLVLPKLHLRAVDMEDINYHSEIQRLLAAHS